MPKTIPNRKKRDSQTKVINPQIIKVGPKGVITIPDENRQIMEIEAGKYLTAIQVGKILILSPEINDFMVLAETFQNQISEMGISPEALLAAQDEARKTLFHKLNF